MIEVDGKQATIDEFIEEFVSEIIARDGKADIWLTVDQTGTIDFVVCDFGVMLEPEEMLPDCMYERVRVNVDVTTEGWSKETLVRILDTAKSFES